MKVEKISIDKLVLNPNNTRMHGELQIKEFKKSIEQFGIIRPVVVDENYVILCGNGLYMALKDMGRKDADVIVMRGLSENQKKKLLLSDNKIYNLGVDDFDAIDKIMNELQGDFDIPGYNSEDLDALYGHSSLSTDAAQDFQIPKVTAVPVSASKATSQHEASPQNQTGSAYTDVKYEVGDTPSVPVDTRRYIICPNCGERFFIDD